MSELFIEIQEDIKRERLEKLWSKVGRFAVWGSIGIIALTAIFVGIDSYNDKKAEERTSQLLQALAKAGAGDNKGAEEAFSKLAEDSSNAYHDLALVQKAIAQEANNDLEGAKKTYAILSKESSPFGELAAMRAGGDSAKSGTVFKYMLLERSAWDALAKNNKAEAGNLFFELANDPQTPSSLATRATEMVRFVAPEKLIEQKAAK